MNAERIGLVVLGLACVGLIGWNMSLSGQLAELEIQKTQAVAAAGQAGAGAVAAGAPDRGMKARSSGGGWNRGGPPGGPRGMEMDGAATAEAKPDATRGERRERRERDWAAMRADMETRTIDTVEAYGATHGWEETTTDDVLNILLDTSDAIGEVWGQVGQGDLAHYQARKEMMVLRQESSDDIIALIGEPAYEALDEHLWEARSEAWRASENRSDNK